LLPFIKYLNFDLNFRQSGMINPTRRWDFYMTSLINVHMRRLMIVLVCTAVTGIAGSASGDAARRLELLSRLQIMSEGTYTAREWNDVSSQLEDLLEASKRNGQWDEFVETRIIQAKVLSARGDHDRAMAMMKETLAMFSDKDVPALKKVYTELASLYARNGDESGVANIMNQFKASRHYDAEAYAFSGGGGPSDPIVLTRPQAGASESISVTAMNVQRIQARYAAGQQFPDFSIIGWNGQAESLQKYRGHVVLVDFWTPGWFAWRRDLPNLKSLYERYRRQGFQIVGLCIDPDEFAARKFVSANGITWTQASAPRDLTAALGVFGEVTNYLLDQHGTILARDVSASQLDAAIREALKGR